MRDIRKDLSDRLNALALEIGECNKRLSDLQEERTSISRILAAENRRFKSATKLGVTPETHIANIGTNTALSQHIRAALADGKPHTLKQIADAVVTSGYPFVKKSPMRMVNFALLAMKRADAVKRVPDPKGGLRLWQLKERS